MALEYVTVNVACAMFNPHAISVHVSTTSQWLCQYYAVQYKTTDATKWQIKQTTLPPKKVLLGEIGTHFPRVKQCVLTHRLLKVRSTGFITKVNNPNKNNHAWLFTAATSQLQRKDISRLQCYSTVCLSACSKSRGLGGEEASPGETLRLHHRVAQIKVYKQRRTPKVGVKPQHRWTWAGALAAVRSLTAVSTGQPDMWQRGAEKHSPQMFPLSPST